MASKPLKFRDRPIADNIILTTKKPTDDENKIRENDRETVLLGAEKVTCGVNVARKVIKVDPNTGLNYLTNDTEAQEIYNLRTQVHSKWFALELMGPGRGYYVGGKQVGDVIGTANIYTDPDTTSQIVTTITNDTLDILDHVRADTAWWYEVKYNGYQGFVRSDYITNIRYIDRTE